MRPSAGGQPANGRRETGDERREVPIALPGRGEVRTRRSLRRVRGRLRAGSCARASLAGRSEAAAAAFELRGRIAALR